MNDVITNPSDSLRGYIPCPCCGKEKALVRDDAHGHVSYRCRNCGQFAMYDYDEMTAVPCAAYRGASHKLASID